ncbi:esterase B1-like [Eupeodes corollae]|uniref:esterase B1-like n=1 Tax=Eupeodes corollae TaxID=290404 RepID=UPI0024907B03|nr:esterase B1-like [Eupeodes corollae]
MAAFSVSFADQLKLAYRYGQFKIRQSRQRTNQKVETTTTYGRVRGVKWKSVYGAEYYSFEGIPYAKPPLGDLRFRAPREPDPWTDVRKCTRVRAKPTQMNFVIGMVQGSEDCLYLNVFTKNLNPLNPLPVLVWIFGGAFQIGEASRDIYSPDYIMQEDVMLVTISYRLGPMGFMSFSDPDVGIPGNAALKDQIMALKWVKNNCCFFGGDPSNITVFGESAGGCSTHYMMLTEQTKGLFHKGIVMSGSAVAPWAIIPPNNWSYRLAKSAGYTGENKDKDVYEFLTKLKPSVMYKHSENLLTKEERHNRISYCFGPVIEPYVSEESVIIKNPVEMMRESWSNAIPLIIGGNSFEGLLMFAEARKFPDLVEELGDCEKVVPFDLPLSPEERKQFGLKIKETYFGDAESCLKNLLQYSDIFSYKYFWHGIHRTILSRSEYATAPTYVYRFDFDSKHFNHVRNFSCGRKIRGTCHGDDLSYLFYNGIAKKLSHQSREYKTIRTMVSLWTQFAATGDPNVSDKSDVKWKQIERNGKLFQCLNISDNLEMIDFPESKKLELWDSMYPRELLY